MKLWLIACLLGFLSCGQEPIPENFPQEDQATADGEDSSISWLYKNWEGLQSSTDPNTQLNSLRLQTSRTYDSINIHH